MENLKYLNVINILAFAKPGALQKIYTKFNGDWKRAWNSDLSQFMPKNQTAAHTGSPDKKLVDPDKEWQKLEHEDISVMTILDQDYPLLLRQIHDPPFLLYIKGDKTVLQNNCFGVVGTRNLSEYGKRATPHITIDLARAGFTIVSGLAAGIDTLAHKTALEASQKTIAVLGCGVDDATVFPIQNLTLSQKIVNSGGAVISEYAPGVHGNKFSFPQRNRIISGLSRGILVIEADNISGAIITAKSALDQNRDVFAIPGNIFAKTSEGTNNIIKKGAKLVTCSDDILEDYGLESKKVKKIQIKGANEFEDQILAMLGDQPVTASEIVRTTGMEPPQVNSTLMIMELNKKIKDIGHGRFVAI